jgi:hypothetical protein
VSDSLAHAAFRMFDRALLAEARCRELEAALSRATNTLSALTISEPANRHPYVMNAYRDAVDLLQELRALAAAAVPPTPAEAAVVWSEPRQDYLGGPVYRQGMANGTNAPGNVGSDLAATCRYAATVCGNVAALLRQAAETNE